MTHSANSRLSEPIVLDAIPVTADDIAKAHEFLSIMPGRRDQAEYVTGYLGPVLEAIARTGQIMPSTIRRGVALYRAWGGDQ